MAFTAYFTSVRITEYNKGLYFLHWEWIASYKVAPDLNVGVQDFDITRYKKLFQSQSKLLHFDERLGRQTVFYFL